MNTVRSPIYATGHQFSAARGNTDVVFTVCRLVDGREVVLPDDDAELEAYFDNREAYWSAHGLAVVDRDGRRCLERKGN